MEDFVWLDVPLHKNKFPKIDLSCIESLKISFDGSIMAVKKDKIADYYKTNEVSLVKAGYKKMPKEISLETEDELYSFLAYFVSM